MVTESLPPTKRELEVAALIAKGYPKKAVAHRLRALRLATKGKPLSEKTVDRHLQNFYAKTGVRSVAGCVHYMVYHGHVKAGDCLDKLAGV